MDYFVFFTLGQLYYWDADYERALTALNQAIEAGQTETADDLPEGLAYAYFYRGNVHAVYRQDRRAAIADYRRALKLAPDFARAAFNLGEALRILGNSQRAQGDEERAVRAYRQAIRAYDQAIRSNPDFAPAYEGRGLAYYEIGSTEAAVEDWESALEREPRAETHHRLGLALRDLGRWDEALAHLDRAIARAPGTGRFYFSRGRLRARLGYETRAIADLRTYLRLSPRDINERRARVKDWLAERGISGNR